MSDVQQPGTINWIKYDRENPPQMDMRYLVTDGLNVDIGDIHHYFPKDSPPRWYCPDRSPISEEYITHYAYINLPEVQE